MGIYDVIVDPHIVSGIGYLRSALHAVDLVVLLFFFFFHPHMSATPLNDPDNQLKKRRKGATRLSCAECRRFVLASPTIFILTFPSLKLRCDRAIPCSSCVKRGCGAICPDVPLFCFSLSPISLILIGISHHRPGQPVRLFQFPRSDLIVLLVSFSHPHKNSMRKYPSLLTVCASSKMPSALPTHNSLMTPIPSSPKTSSR